MAIVPENASDAKIPTPTTIANWAALAGRWTFNNASAEFLGPIKDDPGPPLWLALGSDRFRDGRIETRIKLSRNQSTTAGIVFGYQSLNSPYYIAQVGAYDKAYAISEYRPGRGWTSLADAGTISNINVKKELNLALKVSGQTVRMTVDDVDVLDIVLSRPIEGTGVGLYAWGNAKVKFPETTITGVAPRIFIIMPFSEPFDTLYREVILPVAQQLEFDIVRVDEISGPGIILDDIQQQIEQSHDVVAEISTHNPNVFYELGMHTPSKSLLFY